MKTLNQQFDEEFKGIYYGKDEFGVPNYPPETFIEDVKQFYNQKIAEIIQEMRTIVACNGNINLKTTKDILKEFDDIAKKII